MKGKINKEKLTVAFLFNLQVKNKGTVVTEGRSEKNNSAKPLLFKNNYHLNAAEF